MPCVLLMYPLGVFCAALLILHVMHFAEAAGVPTPSDMVSDEMSLDQVIGDLGAYVA